MGSAAREQVGRWLALSLSLCRDPVRWRGGGRL